VLNWFNAREAVDVGVALADQFAPSASPDSPRRRKAASRYGADKALKELLRRAERDARAQRLNFYQRARFANSFKWRLLESGVPPKLAAEVTRRLVVHLLLNQGEPAAGPSAAAGDPSKAHYLFTQGNARIDEQAYEEALGFYQACVRLSPRHAEATNNLAAALSHLGRYQEAERHFREAIRINPSYAEAHGNLGVVLRSKGLLDESAESLRRALKLKPDFLDARCGLGSTLAVLGQLRAARAQFRKALKSAPRHSGALLGLAQLARMEGRFEESEGLLKRALRAEPRLPSAWAELAGLRRMSPADADWLERAEEIAASPIAPVHEAELRFAIGKYRDDVGDYGRAFESYRRANQIMKAMAEGYDRDGRTRFVDDLTRAYTRRTLGQTGVSTSAKPIFVVGMMRSGTSLVEQIIASHPAVVGAGELRFWNDAVRQHAWAIRQGPPDAALGAELAAAYLKLLDGLGAGIARRVVDKAPVNSDYLGLIHSVFPNARIVYLRRDPVDVCLSCYFQQLSPTLNFTMDLSDLAHYYREHHRLVAHWRATLPPATMLDVPYAELVADQEGWTRRILQFLELDWDARCLEFHQTDRPVVTASTWQVRQRIYASSVERWRNYAKFLGPLAELQTLAP
jgi:tetratricopeptide (TPR) repeat protein